MAFNDRRLAPENYYLEDNNINDKIAFHATIVDFMFAVRGGENLELAAVVSSFVGLIDCDKTFRLAQLADVTFRKPYNPGSYGTSSYEAIMWAVQHRLPQATVDHSATQMVKPANVIRTESDLFRSQIRTLFEHIRYGGDRNQKAQDVERVIREATELISELVAGCLPSSTNRTTVP